MSGNPLTVSLLKTKITLLNLKPKQFLTGEIWYNKNIDQNTRRVFYESEEFCD
jgi:hypothetical protein